MLDELDKKILGLLDCHGNMPISLISRRTRQSRDKVEYRLLKLTQSGVIRSFTTVINPHYFGGSIYKIYIKIFLSSQRKKVFIKSLLDSSRVFWIAESDGRWNLMFSIVAENPIEFNEYQKKILSPISSQINDIAVYPLIDGTFFCRKYLDNQNKSTWPLGGKILNLDMDDLDKKILYALSRDARISSSELARSLGMKQETIHYRIRQLEKRKVVLGYRTEFSLSKLEMTLFKAQIKTAAYNHESEIRLQKYCADHPNIVYIVNQIGEAALEIEIEAPDYYHYYKIIDELQEKFVNYIKSVDTILIRGELFKGLKF